MGAAFQKGLVLYEMKRYREAAEQFREELVATPDSARTKAMLALSLAYDGRGQDAWRVAQSVMGDAPTFAFGFYAAAHVASRVPTSITLRRREPRRSFRLSTDEDQERHRRWKLARRYIREALRLAPANVDYLAMLAESEGTLGRLGPSLDAAERGLAIQPDHLGCSQVRSRVLGLIGHTVEGERVATDSLSKNPDHWATHATRGWYALGAGDAKRAEEHFREALRRRPSERAMQIALRHARWARRFPPYRLLFRGAFAMWGLLAVGALRSAAIVTLCAAFWIGRAALAGALSWRWAALWIALAPVAWLVLLRVLLTLRLLRDPRSRARVPPGQRAFAVAVVLLAFAAFAAWVIFAADW